MATDYSQELFGEIQPQGQDFSSELFGQSPPKPEAPSGFARGLGDPIDALAQNLTHILPQPVVNKVNQFNNWLADKGVPGIDRIPEGGMDQAIAQQEQAYQAQRKAAGETGFDWGRLGGNIVNPVNAIPIGGVAQAATIPARVGLSAGRGAAMSGLLSPVTEGDYATEKAKQIALGGALGGATRGVLESTKALPKYVFGSTTGTSPETISAAFQAGKAGDKSFLANMRGDANFNEIVDQAKQGLTKMRMDRASAYRSGMVDIKGDKSIIPFNPISDAMDKVEQMGSFKGQVINKHAASTVQELSETVKNWAGLPKADYHTPEGLDALKQAIGDIRDNTQFGTASRRAADTMYNAVKNEIQAQAPKYAEVMKDYSKASETLKEIEKTFSLGERASKDTAIRKLQSLLRNNVATNYGNRTTLAKTLETQGGVNLTPAIAGQSLSSALPRGIVGAAEKIGIPGMAGLGAIGFLPPAAIPLAVASAAASSPRLVGKSTYGLGRLAGKGQGLLNYLSPEYQGLLQYSPELSAIQSANLLNR